jgi:serine/threonine protein phosphatase PrpC
MSRTLDARYARADPSSQANAGDSRSVISVKGEAKELSFDHKPWDKSEFSEFRQENTF